MKKSALKPIRLLLLSCVLFSCWDSTVEPIAPNPSGQQGQPYVVTDVYGRQYPSLDPSKLYCGPGWGTKMCHFLYKHDGTVWTAPAAAHSEFPDVKFSNFYDPFFISFLSIDSTAAYCEGWKLGETTHSGTKWNIAIRKDEEDVLWFDYDYYGSSNEIEHTITYKYAVIDDLLHFSSTDGQAFVFHPSAKDYSADAIHTGEIIKSGGCLF